MDSKTELDTTRSDEFEEVLTFWVCPSCGYMEEADIEEEDTPVLTQSCPECGAEMHRLNSVELFHLWFLDDDPAENWPHGALKAEPIDKLDVSFPGVRDEQEPPEWADGYELLNIEAKGHSYVFAGSEGLVERSVRLLERSPSILMRMLRSEARIVSVDGQPSFGFGYGVFCPPSKETSRKDLSSRIGNGFTIKDARGTKFVSDNAWRVRIKIDEQIHEFVPKSGYPFDKAQVSGSKFEDFVRRCRNARGGRMLAFLLGNGIRVEKKTKTESSPFEHTKYVKPNSRESFLEVTAKLDEAGIFWRGGVDLLAIEECESLLEINDILEDLTTGDVDPGYVVRKDQFPDYDKFEKIIQQTIEGKPVEIGMSQAGNITFEFINDKDMELEQAIKETVLILGDPHCMISHEEGKYTVTMSVGPDALRYPDTL